MAVSDTRAASNKDAPQQARQIRGSRFLAAGGVLGAVAASLCCIVPLLLFTLGVGGAWIGSLTAFAPYQPLFVAVSLICIGGGFYLVSRRPKAACADASACAKSEAGGVVKPALWIAAVLVLAVMTFPYYAPLLIGRY